MGACSLAIFAERTADKTLRCAARGDERCLTAEVHVRIAREITVEGTARNGIVKNTSSDIYVRITGHGTVIVTAKDIAEVTALYGNMCVSVKRRIIITRNQCDPLEGGVVETDNALVYGKRISCRKEEDIATSRLCTLDDYITEDRIAAECKICIEF